MDINNKNELQTHQGMDSRHMQTANCSDKKELGEPGYGFKTYAKVNCSDKKYWENTELHINIVINDRLTDLPKSLKRYFIYNIDMLF